MQQPPLTHTQGTFDTELAQIRSLIEHMLSLVGTQLREVCDAFATRDSDLCGQVIASDAEVDVLLARVEDKVTELIVRRQPVARDVRFVLSAFKHASDIELIGDYCKNNAKRTRAIISALGTERDVFATSPIVQETVTFSRAVHTQFLEIIRALDSRELDQLIRLRDQDQAIDAAYGRIFHQLSAQVEGHFAGFVWAHLLFIVKNHERIGDLLTHIIENAYYFIAGEKMPDRDVSLNTAVYQS